LDARGTETDSTCQIRGEFPKREARPGVLAGARFWRNRIHHRMEIRNLLGRQIVRRFPGGYNYV
jgi:hypothetical protein